MKETLFKEFMDNMYSIYNLKVSKKCMEFCQGENRILLKLSMESERTITPTELSNELEISRQRITSILNSLKAKDFINMKMAEDDRRKIIIELSPKGKKYIDKKGDEIEEEMKIFMKKLGEEKLSELNELLKILNK